MRQPAASFPIMHTCTCGEGGAQDEGNGDRGVIADLRDSVLERCPGVWPWRLSRGGCETSTIRKGKEEICSRRKTRMFVDWRVGPSGGSVWPDLCPVLRGFRYNP